MDTSRVHKELLRRQPTATSTGATELEPGQPVFVKELHGNVWRTATVDQPAAEPDSYWVRFPDNAILRRTRSMIKPRSLPSHFELQAKAKEQRNFEGDANSHFCDSFNQLNGQSMLPVMPMTSVTTPASINRDSKVSEITDPISSTGETRPTSDSGAAPSPVTPPRCSTQSTKGVPSNSLHPIQQVTDDVLVTFHVCKLCSDSVSFIQYGLVKHGLCGLLPHL